MTWLIYALVLAGCLGLTFSVAAVASTMDADKKVHAAAFGLVAGTLTLLLAAAVAIPEKLALRAVFVGIALLVTTPVAAQALLRLSRNGLVDYEANADVSAHHDVRGHQPCQEDHEAERDER